MDINEYLNKVSNLSSDEDESKVYADLITDIRNSINTLLHINIDKYKLSHGIENTFTHVYFITCELLTDICTENYVLERYENSGRLLTYIIKKKSGE